MRGKVEVYAIASDGSQELVLSEPNLIVNGAGESIVDMLTTPSSTLGIAPRVMDTSNWRWGAISFGPAASSFQENAYYFPGLSSTASSLIDQISADHQLRVLWVSGSIGEANGATTSSYTPPYRLPSYPDPLNKKLEDANTAYSIVSGDGTQSFGQFENRIEFNPEDASSYFQGAFAPYFSVFPTASSVSGMLVSSYEGDFQADPSANRIVFYSPVGGDNGGKYNYNRQMDYRGFVSATHNATNQADPPVGRVYVSGSVPNDLTGTTSQVADPRVSIYTQINIPDVWAMNVYGGLHQIGLWSVDCKKSLENNAAPFLQPPELFRDHADGVSKLEFKLFAKKTFTENMTQNRDNGVNSGFRNHKKLRIEWTIDFRADGGYGLV